MNLRYHCCVALTPRYPATALLQSRYDLITAPCGVECKAQKPMSAALPNDRSSRTWIILMWIRHAKGCAASAQRRHRDAVVFKDKVKSPAG